MVISKKGGDYSIQQEHQEGDPLISTREQEEDELILPPRDHYHFTYFSMVLFGVAALLPWNMFITATAYYDKKFKPGSPFIHSQFENFFTIFSQITNVAFLFINVHLQSRFTAFSRIMSSLLVMLLMFITTVVFVWVDTSSWTDLFFIFTVFTIILFNACSGVFAGGIFGLAASFTSRYIQVAQCKSILYLLSNALSRSVSVCLFVCPPVAAGKH